MPFHFSFLRISIYIYCLFSNIHLLHFRIVISRYFFERHILASATPFRCRRRFSWCWASFSRRRHAAFFSRRQIFLLAFELWGFFASTSFRRFSPRFLSSSLSLFSAIFLLVSSLSSPFLFDFLHWFFDICAIFAISSFSSFRFSPFRAPLPPWFSPPRIAIISFIRYFCHIFHWWFISSPFSLSLIFFSAASRYIVIFLR